MAEFMRDGYGQVEPNQLSAQKTGQIYASLKLDPEVKVLQNGEFMFYSYADNMVTANPSVEGQEPMLVFNEIKLYEPFWRTTYKDFAMIRVGESENYVTSKLATMRYDERSDKAPGEYTHEDAPYRMEGCAPRVFKTNIGDIMTTNMVKLGEEYAVGDILTPVLDDESKTMVLAKGDSDTMQWVVAKVYTMPDGQDGLKLQRIK